MFFVDLLYGPPRDQFSIRPTIVDMDTVRELVARAKTLIDAEHLPDHGPATVSYIKRSMNIIGRGETVQAEDLDALSAYDRNTLHITVERAAVTAVMSFSNGLGHAISASKEGIGDWYELRRELEDIILTNGQPVWRPLRFAPLLPVVGAVLFVAIWGWLLLVTPLPLPGMLLGWIASGVVVTMLGRWSYRLAQRERIRQSRHRIRMETRAETHARRIDAKANLKVGVTTAALALPIGFALAVLTNAFGLKG
ncbi:hypothetical protein DEU35_1442 [Microbacterium sp. AG157]|uniref:hypothetical protein n=1 Tax=Microbacterium sp. AG157 TaxID=2183993 RepID=UPI000E238922|nr:hypothetical protein [Microbacterium sp. AG157]REC98342.1 hypothetical protein DEU35_1442 [Microbacterium sp. AG157]